MNTAVRYYSRTGNTRIIAETIAKCFDTAAVSVDAEGAALDDGCDVLFIGGALYAYGLDKALAGYLANIDASKVGKAVVFSTSWLSKHAVDLIKKALAAKGIDVCEDFFYSRGKPSGKDVKAAEEFAKKFA
ncbi:MAG: hypothetical protein ILO53_03150 [Clostridia bacterium]|nr:hypothetical protein [Clostridia bacterium]